MNSKILIVLFYVIILEIIACVYLSFRDFNNTSLELGAFVLGTIDIAITLYYTLLAWIVKRNPKNVTTLKIICLIMANLVPIVFYLHLMDYI